MPTSPSPHQNQPVYTSGAPLAEATGAVILIHGRGATAESILTLAPELDRPEFAYLAPQAAGSTWYPYSFLAPVEQNEPHLSSALALVEAMLDEIGAAGIPAERTLLLGFSQGACLASEFVARHPRRYGGLAALSGGLIGRAGNPEEPDGESPNHFKYGGSLAGTPVFLGCSDVDPHIPRERVEKTARILRDLDAEVTMQLYPGMPHTVNQDEIDHVRALLDAIAQKELG